MARLFALLVCLFGFHITANATQRQVALELVLAVDTSSSVDAEEFELQRRGIADAFAHPDLIAVIEGMGSIGIAVMMVEWSGTGQQHKIVDWSLLTDSASARQFSNKVMAAPRALKGSTDIGSVIRYSVDDIERNQFAGNRRVIDVSGDGSSNSDSSIAERDRAVLRGITINGLVILSDLHRLSEVAEVDLIRHYSNKVIGGNGAFLITAQGFEDFREAMLQKLMREILGNGTAHLQDHAPADTTTLAIRR